MKESMQEIVLLEIEKLQPTQSTLTLKTIEFYLSTFPLLREKSTLPEIWKGYKKDLLIVDGHNQLWESLMILQRPYTYCRLITPKNFKLGNQIYEEYLNDFIKKRDITRNQGVYKVRDLTIPQEQVIVY
ncbi:MAG: hypothetical protein QXW97_02370 [Candidatus Pacearchaeota archaeon]